MSGARHDPRPATGPRIALSLGGVTFDLDHAPGLAGLRHGHAYREFLRSLPWRTRSGQDTVHVRLRTRGRIPEIGTVPQFVAGGAWALYGHAGVRILVSPPGPLADAATAWVASLDLPRTSRIDLRVGEAYAAGRRRPRARTLHPFSYPLDQLAAVYALAARQGLLVHACGAVVDGRAIVLAGRSGAGKSTLARLLAQAGLGGDLLSDDRVFVRRARDGWRVYGTPWPGDALVARNRYAPLGALAFLTQGRVNSFRPLSLAEALPRLLETSSLLWFDREPLDRQLRACERLIATAPVFEFVFRKDAGAAEAVRALRSATSRSATS